MRRSDSILQQFYMSKLPKAQGGLLFPMTRPVYDNIPSPGKRLEEFNRMQAARAAAPARLAAKQKADAQVIADRRARINASIQARNKPFSAQQLADETQAIGDKFRIFPNDPNSFIDEYLNPGVFIGNMASQLGRAPLDIKRGNYGKAAMSVVTPLVLGAAEAIATPLIQKAGRYITTKLNPKAINLQRQIAATSGIDDLGIYNQIGNKKYYTLGDGFGDIGTAEQRKSNFINKLSDSEFSDYVSKLSNAERRKLYGLPAYDIDKNILNESKNLFLQLQRSGEDYIHPYIRNANWREMGDEFRGVMRQWNLEPTSQKDVEKFRKLWINDQYQQLSNSKPMGFGEKATYLNNPIILNREGGPIIDSRGQWAHPGK